MNAPAEPSPASTPPDASCREHMLNGYAHCRVVFDGDVALDVVYLAVNHAFERLTGFSDVVGKRLSEIAPGIRESDPELIALAGRIARGGKPEQLESFVRGMNNWFAMAMFSPARDEVVLIFDVITDRKRTEAALRASEARLRAMFEVAPIGIAQADLRTQRFLAVNAVLRTITGYSEEELLALRAADITHPDDRARDAAAFAAIERGDTELYAVEKRLVRKDGAIVWAKVKVRAVRNTDGSPCTTMATIEDVTERRAADAALDLQTRALQATANGVVITDPDGHAQWVNEAFTRLTGWESKDILGKSMRVLRSGRQPRELYETLWRTILAGRVWHGELVNRRRDGTLYDEVATITPVLGADGKIAHFVAVKQDVTERTRAAAAVAEAEERRRLAFDAVELGMWVHDHASGSVEMDARARSHFGIAKDVVTIDDLVAACHPDDRVIVARAMATGLAPSGPGRAGAVHRVVLPSGEVRWVSVNTQLLRTDSGGATVARTIATSQDVTEATRADERLRASEERYRTLVDSIDEIIFATDTSGTVTYINQAISRLGYRPSDLIGRNRDEFVHPDDLARIRSARAAPSEGRPRQLEYRLIDAAGNPRTVRSAARSLVSNGQFVGMTGVIVDLTELRETEHQLHAAQRMEAVGRLAGGVAHDFNNLLSVILSYVRLSIDELLVDDPMRVDLEEVERAAKRAEGLTRQLLAFSRRQVLCPEVLDLNELIAGTAKMLGRLVGEDILLRVTPAEHLFETRADPGQIEQVVMNLVVNARDAMPDGGTIRIATANVELDAARARELGVSPGPYAVLSVADNGAGMDEATLARIFEPFFTTKAVGKGTGLGLSTVYGIVRQSGGGISVDSTPSVGTTFRIYLARHERDGSERSRSHDSVPPPRGTETILVVEDDDALRMAIQRMLGAAGYDVLVAAGGAEAVRICEAAGERIRLVLTDVVMPVMNGRAVAERLKALCPKAKTLFMSGYADEAIERHGVLGDGFIRKPFDAKTIAAAVRSALDGRPVVGAV